MVPHTSCTASSKNLKPTYEGLKEDKIHVITVGLLDLKPTYEGLKDDVNVVGSSNKDIFKAYL